MSVPIPCRVCACLDGEPGLCHALTTSGLACYRVKGYPDWCSACGTWDKDLRKRFPSLPIEALSCEHRAQRAEEAATKRSNQPGAYALRVHAVRMRRKARQLAIDAGVVAAPAPLPVREREVPLCPQ